MSDDSSQYPQKYGPWVIQGRAVVYQDPWLKVTRDTVIRPDGSPGTYSVSHMKPGVCVLAIDHQGICHLTEEFHYAVGKLTVECVSGGIEPGEGAFETAQRELAEELGLIAGKWTDLGVVDPFTAIALSPTSLWLAEDLTTTETNLDASEIIRHVEIPFEDVMKKAMSAEITHAPSVSAILKAWIIKSGTLS